MTQYKDTIRVETDTNEHVLVGRPCELSAFSFVPTHRCDPKHRTYYNFTSNKGDHSAGSDYDQLFHQDYGFDKKLHRCDRAHAISRGLKVNAEEKTKAVPTLSSSSYGHALDRQLDHPGRDHVRIGHVQSEFYRRNGINARSPGNEN